MDILAGYTGSKTQDFEIKLRTEVGLVEDDIRRVLDKYNSSFVLYDTQPGIYSFLRFSSRYFELNIQDFTTQLMLNLMTFPWKLNWLQGRVL